MDDRSGNKGFGKAIKHVAVFGGVEYTLTATQWMAVLDSTQSQIHRGLLKHYSMQALIDKEFSKLSDIKIMWRKFCFSGVKVRRIRFP